jgi:hypothetical protein
MAVSVSFPSMVLGTVLYQVASRQPSASFSVAAFPATIAGTPNAFQRPVGFVEAARESLVIRQS